MANKHLQVQHWCLGVEKSQLLHAEITSRLLSNKSVRVIARLPIMSSSKTDRKIKQLIEMGKIKKWCFELHVIISTNQRRLV